jgi:hypothetical protein
METQHYSSQHMALSMMTLSIMTLSMMTLSVMTLSMMTLCILNYIATLSLTYFIVILCIEVMLNVILLSVAFCRGPNINRYEQLWTVLSQT